MHQNETAPHAHSPFRCVAGFGRAPAITTLSRHQEQQHYGARSIPFLMYPQGENANGRIDSLDPSKFSYKITSRELTA